MDRMAYAKHRYDVNTMGWVRVLVMETLILPLLSLLSSQSCDCALCAANCAARILARVSQLHATRPSWFSTLAMLTAAVLQNVVVATSAGGTSSAACAVAQPLKEQMSYLATWLIALRGVPLWPDLFMHFVSAADDIIMLPFTTAVPASTYSAGLLPQRSGNLRDRLTTKVK